MMDDCEKASLISHDSGSSISNLSSASRLLQRIASENNEIKALNAQILLFTVSSSLGGFLFGYDTGVISGAMLMIKDDPGITLDTLWTELIVSVTLGSAWLFSLIAGPSTEYFGRKRVILAASVVFIVGPVVMGIAENKQHLLIGRIITGVGIGLASVSVPMYIGESAPSDYRGYLVTCYQLAVTFGIFIANCICGAFSDTKPDGWRYMLALAGIPAIFQFFGVLFMPESPRWLVSKGKIGKARDVLKQIRTGTFRSLEDELQSIISSLENEKSYTNTLSVIKRITSTPSARKPLILGCLLQMFQQVAGINTVMYYSATIISMAGFSKTSQAIWISAAVAFVNFICSFIAFPLVERIGRRILVLVSLFGITLSLMLLGVGFQITGIDSFNGSWMVVVGLCLYLLFFAPGMGPMPWTINSEIYPTWSRSLSQSIATSCNWAFNLLISMTFLSLTEAMTEQGTFYMYAVIAFIGFVIFYGILPETKGKTLEEMEELFTS